MSKKVNVEIRPILKKMEVNQVEHFDIDKVVNVRNTCSQLKKRFGFEFKTSQDNENKVIEVTRTN